MKTFFHARDRLSANVPFPPESARTERKAIVTYIEAYTLCILSALVASKEEPMDIVDDFFEAVRDMTLEQLWIFACYLYNMDGRMHLPIDIKVLFPDYIRRYLSSMRREGFYQYEFLVDAINKRVADKLDKYITNHTLQPTILNEFKDEVNSMPTSHLWTFYSFLTGTPRFFSSNTNGNWYDKPVVINELPDYMRAAFPKHFSKALEILPYWIIRKSKPLNISVKKSPPFKPLKSIKTIKPIKTIKKTKRV